MTLPCFHFSKKKICSQLYLNGELIEDCICFKKDYHITYLWNIKKGISLPNMDEVTSDLEEMKAKAETLENHPELEQLVKDKLPYKYEFLKDYNHLYRMLFIYKD